MQKYKAVKQYKSIVRGSLICAMLIMMIASQAALAASLPAEVAALPEPRKMSVEQAKNGIVRINAGIENENGAFSVRSTASGFIVGNDGSNVFVVTALHAVDYGQDGRIQIVVKNDSAVDAEIELSNKQKDYCILTAENKFNDRDPVPLRVPSLDAENDMLADGDEVTALGFPSSMGSASEFSAGEVPSKKGTIIRTAGENSGFILHDSKLMSGFDGGALVDKDGYAIGLIMGGEGNGSSSALDITDVDTSLYQEAIAYRSKDKDLMYKALYDLCAGAEELYNKADKDSKTEISRQYNEAISTLSEGPYDRDALSKSLLSFNAVIGNTDYKTPKALILLIALAVLIIILAIRLTVLISWNKKHSYAIEPVKVRAAEQSGSSGYHSTQEIHERPVPAKNAQLVVERTGKAFMIKERVTSLGKSPESSLSIPDNQKVSRHHALIENRGGAFYISDQGSTNGTFLNNKPVGREGIRLQSGDVIRLANEEIRILLI